MDYHVHLHCIVSGGGLTKDRKIRKSRGSFFIPVHVLRDKFQGKFLAELDALYKGGAIGFPPSGRKLAEPCEWRAFRCFLQALFGKTLYVRRLRCLRVLGTFTR